MKVLNIKQLAEYMGICEKSARKLLVSGAIKGKIVARKWLTTDEAVKEYMDN